MSDFRGLYDIRPGKESDKNFVLATFLRGLYYGDSWFSRIPKGVFMDNYKKIAEHLVKNGIVYIACLKDDPDVIIGYSLISLNLSTLHWVYVKGSKHEDGLSWRGKGIARSLVPHTIDTISHLSKTGDSIVRAHDQQFKNVIFNPFKI